MRLKSSFWLMFFLMVCFIGCKHTQNSAANSAVRQADDVSEDLANKSYCRMVGAMGGGRVETCLNFYENGSGEEKDTSGGIPRNEKFAYYVSGDEVTITVSDSPTVSRTRVLKIAEGTLTLQEGTNMFVWTLKNKEDSPTDRLSNTSYCRMVGAMGGGRVETCLNFHENGSGEEKDTSGGIPRNEKFTYYVSENEVTVIVPDGPLASRTRVFELDDNDSTLTLTEGSNKFVWKLKR